MKPMLFNTEMVQALLVNRKTVTRRKIKLDLGMADADKNDKDYLMIPDDQGDYHHAVDYCGYQVGDIIYVKETHCPNYFDEFVTDGLKCAYKADWNPKLINGTVPEPKWKPSIHMPKELARIFLKVTGVRVEKIQEITIDDIEKEGYPNEMDFSTMPIAMQGIMFEWWTDTWNSTIKKQDLGKYDMKANPWVWVIEFERVNRR